MYHEETQTALDTALDKAREQIKLSDRDDAARRWIEAKNAEEAAKLARLAVESEIVALFGNKPEGSQTVKSERFAVETTGNMDYKIDATVWASIKSKLPKSVRDSIVKTKPELSVSAYRALDAESRAIFSECLTVKPAKTGVKVSILSLS